jgi:hypothetical protein
MQQVEVRIYSVIATPLVSAVAMAGLALYRNRSAAPELQDERHRREKRSLQLLLGQSIVPLLQFVGALNVDVTRSDRILRLCLTALAFVALFFFMVTFIGCIRYARGAGRVFLPLLSLLILIFSLALFFTLFATA